MKRLAITCVLAALGCGGGSSTTAPATFNGTVHGQPMTPADAVSSPAQFTFDTTATGTVTGQVGAIAITDVASVCPKVSANQTPRNGKAFVILLANVTVFPLSITAPTAAGTFTVFNPAAASLPPSRVAVVMFQAADATCAPISSQAAVGASGTVRLDSISSGSYSGTFNVVLDTGETVTGEFRAASCPGLATYIATPNHGCG